MGSAGVGSVEDSRGQFKAAGPKGLAGFDDEEAWPTSPPWATANPDQIEVPRPADGEDAVGVSPEDVDWGTGRKAQEARKLKAAYVSWWQHGPEEIPSQRVLAELLGCSQHTADRYAQALQQMGLVEISPGAKGLPDQDPRPSVYRLITSCCATAQSLSLTMASISTASTPSSAPNTTFLVSKGITPEMEVLSNSATPARPVRTASVAANHWHPDPLDPEFLVWDGADYFDPTEDRWRRKVTDDKWRSQVFGAAGLEIANEWVRRGKPKFRVNEMARWTGLNPSNVSRRLKQMASMVYSGSPYATYDVETKMWQLDIPTLVSKEIFDDLCYLNWHKKRRFKFWFRYDDDKARDHIHHDPISKKQRDRHVQDKLNHSATTRETWAAKKRAQWWEKRNEEWQDEFTYRPEVPEGRPRFRRLKRVTSEGWRDE